MKTFRSAALICSALFIATLCHENVEAQEIADAAEETDSSFDVQYDLHLSFAPERASVTLNLPAPGNTYVTGHETISYANATRVRVKANAISDWVVDRWFIHDRPDFMDSFENGDLSGWTEEFGDWGAARGYLETTSARAAAITYPSADPEKDLWFDYCLVEGGRSDQYLTVAPWYVDAANQVYIRIQSDTIQLVQVSGGVTRILSENLRATSAVGRHYFVYVRCEGDTMFVWRGIRGEAMERVVHSFAVKAVSSSSLRVYVAANTDFRIDDVLLSEIAVEERNPVSVTMTKDLWISPLVTHENFDINVSINRSGVPKTVVALDPPLGTSYVESDGPVTLTADLTYSDGVTRWHFAGWSSGGDGTNPSLEIASIDSDKYVTANYVLDPTTPWIDVGEPSRRLTNTGPVDYIVRYNLVDSIGLNADQIHVGSPGTVWGDVRVMGDGNRSRTVRIENIKGNGSLALYIDPGTGVSNEFGAIGGFGPSATFEVDNTRPVVTISNPSMGTTKSIGIYYRVSYSDVNLSLVTLDRSDITLNTSGDAAAGSVVVSGLDPDFRTVTIDEISGKGTIGISVAANTAVDRAGNMARDVGPSGAFSVGIPAGVILPSVSSEGPGRGAVIVSPPVQRFGKWTQRITIDDSDPSHRFVGFEGDVDSIAPQQAVVWPESSERAERAPGKVVALVFFASLALLSVTSIVVSVFSARR